jgi:hypothetical protein
MRDARDLERVRVDAPLGRHVVDVAGAPARHDGDVVEVVAALRGLPQTDLDHVTHDDLLTGVVVGSLGGHLDVVRWLSFSPAAVILISWPAAASPGTVSAPT